MTPRQQRRAQQKAERKARKVEARRQSHFTREATAASTAPEIGFESQNEDSQADVTQLGFESQQRPATIKRISEARLAANRANAQHSCGPRSSLGKSIVSQNRIRHGLTGEFRVLSNECQADFDRLTEILLAEHAPADETEAELVRRMAESLWLSRRALRLQDACIETLQSGTEEAKKPARKELALLMRYQTTHDLAFTRCSNELRKRRAERRKIERGFESQRLRQAQESRRLARENRKQEKHELDILLAQAKLERVKPQRTSPQPGNLAQQQAA